MLALSVCFPGATLLEQWPQVCCVKIKFELLSKNCFVSTRTNSIKCFVNWISMLCKVDFSKYARWFEQNLALKPILGNCYDPNH